ncbi:hypothetical protein [Microbacterium laevaniformans]|uniref:hypothetical protein n=1 Tax=Microbacterium laevaniformans TaxID=36807 RepID=UPI003D95FE46
MESWPHDWCDFASYVIAGVLSDNGFGDWDVISAADPETGQHHTWIELVAPDERVLYSIDATLHQFSDIGEVPFYGAERSPAWVRFSQVRTRGKFSTLFWGNGPYTEALEAVRNRMAVADVAARESAAGGDT